MKVIDQQQPGSFCWIELGTTRPECSQEVLHLVIWLGSERFSHRPGEVYTVFRLRSRRGQLRLSPYQEWRRVYRRNSARPLLRSQHAAAWLPYFEVTSCDQSAAKANQLGAKFCLEPMTMENVGRFAILSDLLGATFAIFEASLRAKSKA